MANLDLPGGQRGAQHGRMPILEPFVLESGVVRLEPLSLDHLDRLVAAGSEDRSTYRFTSVPPDVESMRRYLETALTDARAGKALPFCTVDRRSGRVVGSTRFWNVEWWPWPGPPAEPLPAGPDAVEIGWTWLAASAQRTAINTEAKLLMMRHAFESWRVRRLTLKTDERNERSRRAIERVGGKLDGILRAHMPAYNGGIRTTAIYSILPDEWPAVRARLEARLA